jgi:DNA helicase HerA-like ATPase
MNVEDALRRAAKELSDLERWNAEKRKWAAWWEERVQRSFSQVWRAVPQSAGDGLRLTTTLSDAVTNIGELIERLTEPFQTKTIMFKNLRERLEENQNRVRRRPSAQTTYSPRELIRTYLTGTPLGQIFDAEVEILIPHDKRFEHTWFLAGSGSGKTTAFRWMILEDLQQVARGEASVIIMEPKGDLLDYAYLPLFREQPDRLVIIDPRDRISINPFERARDDLPTFNAAFGALRYVIEGIMGSGFTGNHETVFSFAFELVWRIPGATVFTLIDLLQRGLVEEFKRHIDDIPEWEVRKWLLQNFDSREYAPRRTETAQRLNIIIKDPAFRSLFGRAQSTFDLFDAMNEGKLILINADKNILDERAKAYGRYFIALIDRAAKMRRHYMRGQRKIPVFCYIDEAHDYIKDDKKTEEILAQARDQHIGLLLAHQDTQQVGNIKDSLFTNTSIKVATRPEVDIARLSESMHADRTWLTSLPEFHFAVAVRNRFRAVSVKFPFTELDRMSEDEFETVRQNVRDRYTYPAGEPQQETAEPPPEPSHHEPEPPDPPKRRRSMGTL